MNVAVPDLPLEYDLLGMILPWMLLVTSLSKMWNVGLAPFFGGPAVLPSSPPSTRSRFRSPGMLTKKSAGSSSYLR